MTHNKEQANKEDKLRDKIADVLHFRKFTKDGKIWYDDEYTQIYSSGELDKLIKELKKELSNDN